MSSNKDNPFSLDLETKFSNPVLQSAFKLVKPGLEWATSLKLLKNMYQEAQSVGGDFVQDGLRTMDVTYEITRGSLDRIPEEGPVVVVANHPFGGIEGVVLMDLLRGRREDSKLMANYLLSRVAELRDYFVSVDPFGGGEAQKKNIGPLRESIKWLKTGRLLGVFPSGTVSHFQFRRGEVSDPAWSDTVSRIVKSTNATVVPIYFYGENSKLFQTMGVIHPLLRTLLLPREFTNKRGTTIKMCIGNPIPPEKSASFDSDQELTSFLRLRTYILGQEDPAHKKRVRKITLVPKRVPQELDIAPAEDLDKVVQEVEALPAEQMLLESGEIKVYFAESEQIPCTLKELGRLREITFRDVQEGTGQPRDIDRFDSYYTHLFLWQIKKKELVGAYRMVATDKVIEQVGRKGLYTSTLFSYNRMLLDQIGPGLELGRSFVRKEYQKNYSSLLMLWKGIGHYVARHPQYRVLFGTVCINNEYDTISRQLIISFLRANNFLPEFAKLIKARNPMKSVQLRGVDKNAASIVVKDLDDVSELLGELEATHSTVPVLLRQYLRLGGKLLGFNLDPSFGDVLDGLIFVDLAETDRKLLARYLGDEGSESFLKYHGISK